VGVEKLSAGTDLLGPAGTVCLSSSFLF